jgi:antitoxin (DNA-binding transcriptional repressor) of toxin-antitoxin stability system
MAHATGDLSVWARAAHKEPVVVLRRGKPFAAVVPLDDEDWEDFVVSRHPEFLAILQRSQERYEAEGGITLEEMKRRHVPSRIRAPRPAKRTAAKKPVAP